MFSSLQHSSLTGNGQPLPPGEKKRVARIRDNPRTPVRTTMGRITIYKYCAILTNNAHKKSTKSPCARTERMLLSRSGVRWELLLTFCAQPSYISTGKPPNHWHSAHTSMLTRFTPSVNLFVHKQLGCLKTC
jgi:hypothetical protein